jgi:Ca2+-binding EF-hand superfamily protein
MTTQDDLKDLQRLFLSLDTSSDGFLSVEELRDGMRKSIGLQAASTDWNELLE